MAAALGTLAVVSFYLIAQMVGAGNLIRLLFGLPYETAVVIVGAVMLAYVLFGGMIATTWVQIVKAVLLLGGRLHPGRAGAVALPLQPAGALRRGGDALRRAGAGAGPARHQPARRDLAGPRAHVRHRRAAPHPDALLHRARRAHGAHLRQLRDRLHRLLLPADVHPRLRRDGPRRRARPSRRSTRAATWRRRCSRPRSGGTGFLGFISAVAFATILAVVAGLTLSGAAALSHDLWVNVVRRGEAPEREQLRVAPRRDRAAGRAVDRARHRLQGPERRLHGRPGLRDRGQRQLPRAGAVASSGGRSPRAARRPA